MRKIFLLILLVAFSLPAAIYAQGCMEASSDEGVNVVGYMQSQFEYKFHEDEDENSFTINRARMGAVGNIPYDFSYYIMFEFSPNKDGAPYLLDGFITYSRLAPFASISLGQFKSPFSLELNTPCQGLHTIRRSMVVSELASPDRDLGVLISGRYNKLAKYAFAFTNGTGRGNLEDNQNKTFAGRVVITPVEFLSIGGSYKSGTAPATVADADEDERTRFAGEFQFKYTNILVQAEYIQGEDVGSYTTGGGCGGDLEIHEGTVKRSGYWAQAMYMTDWNLQPVVKYESYDPNTDGYDVETDLYDYATIITFGVNYFFNDWTRLQLNYLYKAEEPVEISNDEILMQLQVKF